MIKIAILSNWHVHAKDYINALLKMKDCEISVIWDDDKNRGMKMADEFNIPFESSLEKVLSDNDIDGVVITSETKKHKELMIKAANAKKHIFSEKIMAFTSDDCLEIKKAVEENNILFTLSLVYKTNPILIKIKELLSDNVLGKITFGRIRNAHKGSIAGWLPESFYSKDDCGGGAMIDLGAHPMYLINWYMGEPKSMVSSFTSVTKKAVEDNAVTLIEFEDGAIAVSETSFVSSCSKFSIEFSGTEGSLYANLSDKVIEYKNDSMADWVKITDFDSFGLKTPLESWVQSVIKNESAPFGTADGLILTKFMECAYNSFETEKRAVYK